MLSGRQSCRGTVSGTLAAYRYTRFVSNEAFWEIHTEINKGNQILLVSNEVIMAEPFDATEKPKGKKQTFGGILPERKRAGAIR